ncbi:MAG: ATP synthase F1 subunit epsilon [Clostridia bacterium]|nr:ATP synthase F1 subunit epsilon [Clostridia bacterium]
MTTFPLKIVTPDGLIYDGPAEEVVVRTTSGDLGIMAGHTNCVAPLGMGRAMILTSEGRRYAACIGGMISVLHGEVSLVPTTFEWSDKIDLKRAMTAEERARKMLENKDSSKKEARLAEARLRRALVRRSVAEQAQSRPGM